MNSNAITEGQSFALGLLCRALRINQARATWDDWMRVVEEANKPLKHVHWLINDELTRYSQTEEFKKARFIRFKAGDAIIVEEQYPTSISVETVREALINFGIRHPGLRSRAAVLERIVRLFNNPK